MKNISATLAIVWRIAGPYFRSEDKWAGRGLLAAVITMELVLVAVNVLLSQWQNRFFNALQAYELEVSSRRSGSFSSSRRSRSRCRSTSSTSTSGSRSAGGNG